MSTACPGLSARLQIFAQNCLQELVLLSPEASCPEYLSNDCVIKTRLPYDQEFIVHWRSNPVELSVF